MAGGLAIEVVEEKRLFEAERALLLREDEVSNTVSLNNNSSRREQCLEEYLWKLSKIRGYLKLREHFWLEKTR